MIRSNWKCSAAMLRPGHGRKLAVGLLLFLWASSLVAQSSHKSISFEDRVRAQEAIERVYYEHRIWPKENPGPKPPFEVLVPRAVIESKVEDYLKKSAVLDQFWRRPLAGEQLQAEMDRMAVNTKDPAMLREIFAALGNDPFLIAECLARPLLADRLARNWASQDARMQEEAGTGQEELWSFGDMPLSSFAPPEFSYALPDSGDLLACPEQWNPGSLNGPLQERQGHTAVWTGTEMIVWGGYRREDSLLYNSGGRYNPATDTWTQIATGPDCPAPRLNHTAIWTGTEMIVWGGSLAISGYVFANTGGRYNPSSDAWTATSTGTNCPVARMRPSAVWTGSRMIIWGGISWNPYTYRSDGGRYNPSDDTWAPVSTGANCPVGRESHSAVYTGSLMLIWGGSNGNGTYVNTGSRYDPALDEWTPMSTASAPQARTYHATVWTGSGMYVWGGYGGSYLNSGGYYRPSDDTWTPTSLAGNYPAGRAWLTAVWTGTELIVWGGSDGGSKNSGGRYSPSGNTWTRTSTTGNCPLGRAAHTAVWTGSEMVVWGGDIGGYSTLTGARYSPDSDTWVPTSVGTPVSPRTQHTAVWTGSEMIVWGGSPATNTGGLYAPATDSWTVTGTGTNLPEARYHHTAVWTGVEMIIWGGYGSAAEALNSGGRYDPATLAWTPTPLDAPCPSPRADHTAVWTGTEMIIWGDPYSTSGGRYSPSLDRWMSTSTAAGCPTARYGHSAVWTGSEMIVWGGYSAGGVQNTGARYDPSSDAWTPTSTAEPCPLNRRYASMVWTGAEMLVWGGEYASSQPLNTGARYYPQFDAWSSMSQGTSTPEARYWNSAVWTGEELIVWAGYMNVNPPLINSGGRYRPATDTWTLLPQGIGCPGARQKPTAVWTGAEMLVWGGDAQGGSLASGGAYAPGYLSPVVRGPWDGCAGESKTLTTDGFDTYQWAKDGVDIPGATAGSLVVAEGGNYTVRVTEGGGCSGTSGPHLLTFHALPTPSVTGAVTGCTEPGIVLSAGSYSVYQWIKDGGDIPGATGSDYTATTSGSYAVRVTDSYGCVGTSPAHAVTLAASPVPAVTGDASGCANTGVVLSTGYFVSYQWKMDDAPIPGATSQTYVAAFSGTYTVTVTDATGCPGTSPGKAVTIHANPVPTITGTPTPACQTVQLSTPAAGTYQWYRNGSAIMGATDWTYFAPAPGSYTLRVVDFSGCAGTSAAFVVNADPAPVISGSDSGCGWVQLTTGSFSQYQWYLNDTAIPGATAWTYWAPQSGTYTVRVTNGAGCVGTSPGKTVEVIRPAITGAHLNTCPTVAVELSTAAAVDYLWFYNGIIIPGATGPTYHATVTGTYRVQTHTAEGCWSISDEHPVFVDYCPGTSEVSPSNGIFPLRIVKSGASSTGYYLYYQRLDSVSGFNIYEGNLGALYSHGGAPGNDCGAAFEDLMTGEMRAELTPSSGNRYYLVTAFDSSTEGPSGFDSVGVQIPRAQSTCSP